MKRERNGASREGRSALSQGAGPRRFKKRYAEERIRMFRACGRPREPRESGRLEKPETLEKHEWVHNRYTHDAREAMPMISLGSASMATARLSASCIRASQDGVLEGIPREIIFVDDEV